MQVSALLKDKHPGCRDWVVDFAESGAILSAITLVSHPRLYHMGRSSLIHLGDMPEIKEIARHWSSVYSAVSIVSNRDTPLHRDTGTQPPWYDILATIGGDPDTTMDWPSLGIRGQYRSGTCVLFSGNCIPHMVRRSLQDRVVVAYYMKDNVLEEANVEGAPWMEQDMYSA
jgi:hypothetical protein